MTTCINLRERFGDTYRWDVEESYYAESGSSQKACTDPWYFILVGSRGHVYPMGGERLGLAIDGHRNTCLRLRREPWAKVEQHGDDGINVSFHVDDLPRAAQLAKLYKRHEYSPEALERKRAAAKHARSKLTWTSKIDPKTRPDA